MLEGFYQWVKNIAGFLVFMSLLLKLLPEGKSAKYIKYFMGMILVLIVLAPVGKLFRLEEGLEAFEIQLQQEGEKHAFLTELELKGEAYEEAVVRKYEEALEAEVSRFLLEYDFHHTSVRVRLESEKEKEQFGEILSLEVDLSPEGEEKPWTEDPILIEKKKIQILDEDAGAERDGSHYREAAEDGALKELLAERFFVEEDVIQIRRG